MINYILQVILFQILFLTVYDVFLSKETFFTKNRWYLLLTCIFSFVIPLIKVPSFQKSVNKDFMIYIPEIILSPESIIEESSWYQSLSLLDVFFGVGVIIFSILFLYKLEYILNTIQGYKTKKIKNYTLVFLPKESKAFSFFNYIFLDTTISALEKAQIIQHELVHSKQKHSLDLLFFELLKIVMWFNPMIYLYQQRITLVHEYISDAVATKKQPKEAYINYLLSNFFKVDNISFINQFYKKTLIKKRITMMAKTQSHKLNQLKYLLLIPVLFTMLFYASCSEKESILSNNKTTVKQRATIYTQIGEGPIKGSKSDKETYLDTYLGTRAPGWREITYDDLNFEEREEFENFYDKVKNSDNQLSKITKYKLYRRKNGRAIKASILDFKKALKNRKSNIIEKEEVSFMTIDKTPVYPGCESLNKRCFSKMIQKHFTKNFNTDLPKTLGLEPGRKRVFIQFKVDKNGNVIDIKARAPHKKIEEEVISVMKKLPTMIPGEHDGKTVAVKFSIPFTIVIE